MNPADFCKQHNACSEGKTFAGQFTTMEEVWEKCPNPSWLLWIAARINLQMDQKALRLFACSVVRNTPIPGGRTVWDLLTDPRSRNAVEVAERFANGQATVEELREARQQAAYAADAAYATATAATAAAYYAAYALTAAAAYAAADAAADAAAAADADADADAARKTAKASQADQLRAVIPNPFPV